ncbi:heavy metal-associated isoprenylated plant protein 24-like [Lycium ferocissimum]|uniref:heavy metal-associated isoprenylated plant protein 24-like n=1 Tax=Lycium ferocissimum TaxID=112874 RepID=UPI0028167D4E|nr:heavy metal-associated isoprenylated plant protein 24-like [Lycium ferocissimum]
MVKVAGVGIGSDSCEVDSTMVVGGGCKSWLIGAKSVEMDLKPQKATVTGLVEAKKVLKAAQSSGKKGELWWHNPLVKSVSYGVPHSMVAHPYAAGVYDRKAPPNFVRATTDPAVAHLIPVEEQSSLMFSDENPNACNIM